MIQNTAPVANKPPPRIAERIEVHQRASEVLIGWVQLGVVLVFGTLYMLSPSARSSDPTANPTVWVLAAYLVFTLLRIALAKRNALTAPMLVLSVIVDMALLMTLIWTFHIQYNQPPSFYLKAPTLLYVFVFIALRALRFEVKYIVLAGVTAAVGWAAMVAYAFWFDADDYTRGITITMDYIEYMTSNSILRGAEFDKIVSILVVTAILALAVHRARQMLVSAVAEQTAARDLSRFVPAEVAELVLKGDAAPAAGQTQRGEATVLFVDIEGFTAIGESLSPEQLVQTLNDYFETVCEPIHQHHGVVTQFQGDAILASFNMPSPHPGHAGNAIRAALIILDRLTRYRFGDDLRLNARIGINTGRVVGGLVGTNERLSYTIHGDAVNLAARLESMNKETGTRLLVSKRTIDLAHDDIASLSLACESLGDIEIRGHSEPVGIVAVSARNPDEIRALDT